ncbi:hypothetical protein U1839_18575 [Sphingomonas sp. RT2P30]|uniref:hypothetical protein n=1 Tax=Parasphingomonas halimpatiens TaxID=3096162 RepID=UPI002FC749B8
MTKQTVPSEILENWRGRESSSAISHYVSLNTNIVFIRGWTRRRNPAAPTAPG